MIQGNQVRGTVSGLREDVLRRQVVHANAAIRVRLLLVQVYLCPIQQSIQLSEANSEIFVKYMINPSHFNKLNNSKKICRGHDEMYGKSRSFQYAAAAVVRITSVSHMERRLWYPYLIRRLLHCL